MAYSHPGLQRIGPANSNAPTLWSWADTSVTLAAMDTADYFLDANADLTVGDFIFALGSDGSGIFAVNAVSSTSVDTGNVTQIGGTDSD